MPKTSVTTPGYVVRYAKTLLIGPAIYFALSAAGLYMAILGGQRWTFWDVIAYAAAGLLLLLHVMAYSTAFGADGVEQRVFPRIVRRLRYVEIQRVKWRRALGTCEWLLLISTDGRRMRVYGRFDQLIKAREVLFGQIPQAFED